MPLHFEFAPHQTQARRPRPSIPSIPQLPRLEYLLQNGGLPHPDALNVVVGMGQANGNENNRVFAKRCSPLALYPINLKRLGPAMLIGRHTILNNRTHVIDPRKRLRCRGQMAFH